MKRRFRLALSLVLAVLVIAGPAAARDFTGYEERKDSRGRTVYSNDVRCARGQQADAGGVKVYRSSTGTTSGGIGICNDGSGAVGSKVPIQGRAVAQGNQDGGSVYVDGDKNNSNATAQGWARADGSVSKRTIGVRCGDDRGRKDATAPTAADTQADCG
jgi:hypothetical protein